MGCAPYPVAVRLGNVTLSNQMVARGMNMSVGEPPQAFAFLPLWPLNNSLLYGTDGHCLPSSAGSGPWTSAGCTTLRGGAYDPVASTSHTAAVDSLAYPDDSANDTLIGGPYARVSRVTDRLRLNHNVTLDGFPLGLALSDWGAQGYTPMMAIGLGSNSSLLQALAATGRIASRSYSYFWGRTLAGAGAANTGTASTAAQLDGSVVFGGYDRAKVTGPRYTQPLMATEPECPSQLVVTITDIVLNMANGTDASIFPSSHSSAITACLSPSLSTLMRLPLDPYFATMTQLTGSNIFALGRSVGIYYWNMRYQPSTFQPYDGDLTITLQSGLSVRIPNDQLVRAHTEIEQTTGRILANTSSPDLVMDSLQSIEATKLVQLGWQFFTAAYLHVNQDTRQFSLWAANPTTAQDLVAVDASGAEITDFCVAAATATAASTNSPSAGASGGHRNAASKSATAPSTAVIAGAAVGAVVVVGLAIGLLVWWLLRRRRAAQIPLPSGGSSSSSNQLHGLARDVQHQDDPAKDHFAAYHTTELDGQAVAYELYPNCKAPEKYGAVAREQMEYELPG